MEKPTREVKVRVSEKIRLVQKKISEIDVNL